MKKRRFLAAVLSLMMVLTLVPMTAFAAEGDVTPEKIVTPIITWSRSTEYKYNRNYLSDSDLLESAVKPGVTYTRSNGQVSWSWSDVEKMTTLETDINKVWDYNTTDQYANFTKNNEKGATWNNWVKLNWDQYRYRYDGGSATQTYASVRKFQGTFLWPEGYDLKDVGKIVSANDSLYTSIYNSDNYKNNYAGKTVMPINDDMYVFIHKEGTTLDSNNYMDYLVFWSGTCNQDGALTYNERTGVQAFHDGPDSLTHVDKWYTFADTDGVSTVLNKNYKDGIGAGDKMVIEVYAFDYCGSGGMDELKFQLTKRAATAQQIKVKYYLDTENEAGYLGEATINNVMSGTSYNLSEGTDSGQLNYMKAVAIAKAQAQVTDGVQTVKPYLVVDTRENEIHVLYTSGKKLSDVSFVIDYAKEANFSKEDVFGKGNDNELDKLGNGSVELTVKDGTNGSLKKEVTGTWGKMSIAANYGVKYELQKFMSGIDTYYLNVRYSDTANLQKTVNIIPANNVYYEDDFMVSDENKDTTVGIVYSGEWATATDSMTPDSTTPDSNNPTTADPVSETGYNSVHGWEDALANNTTYSDGSAHVSSASGATASFTFTGTGVDIYSRTDMTTGTVTANLYTGTEAKKAKIKKALVVDNKSVTGRQYYQIPTLSFGKLEHGTYTVKITVTNQAVGRSTYYLDGIRVYNPINPADEDTTVSAAYGEDEIKAVFDKARDLLQSGSAAFIDEGNDEDGNPTDESTVGDYTDSEIGKIAPENEIYLSKDQGVVLKVKGNHSNTYYLGLKAPQGPVNVEVTNGEGKSELSITHSTDLYYKVIPNSNGEITVTNKGDNLLSITKLRTAGTGASGASLISDDEALAAYATFRAANYVPYADEAVSDEELVEQETPAVTEPEIEEPEEVVTEEPGEVIIENPESSEDQPQVQQPASNSWVKKLFGSIKSLFGR